MISLRLTGLDNLQKNFSRSPELVELVVGQALANSIAMIETEAKRLTPVDTGLLRSSIGGAQGFSYVKGLTAGVGTNVKYAIFVELGNGKHKVGQSHFMEDGAKNAMPYVEREFEKAMVELSEKLTS